jgi:hypothetical protein
MKDQMYSRKANTLDELKSTAHRSNCRSYKGRVTGRLARGGL